MRFLGRKWQKKGNSKGNKWDAPSFGLCSRLWQRGGAFGAVYLGTPEGAPVR